MNRYNSRYNEVNTIYNIIRKRTFKIVCLSAVVLATLFIGIYKNGNMTHASNSKEKRVISVEVKSGATLWSIADEYADDDMYKDNNEFVDEVKSINNLSGDNINAGSYLIIPIYE